jgi:low affinity Fe/Cu permease
MRLNCGAYDPIDYHIRLRRLSLSPGLSQSCISRPGKKPAIWKVAGGHAGVFIIAMAIIVVWAATGLTFGYSDTWQLIINTGTTIIIFLMVFLIQNTQNRDTAAIQLKLDELIRANQNARNAMLCLEDLTEDELKRVKTGIHLASGPLPIAGNGRGGHDIKQELEETGKVLRRLLRGSPNRGSAAADE